MRQRRICPSAIPLAALLVVTAACGRKVDLGPKSASASPRSDSSAAPSSAVASPSASDHAAGESNDVPAVGGGPNAAEYGAPPPRGPLLSTTKFASNVYEKPTFEASVAGYLRAGTRVVRSVEKVKGQPAKCTWYGVEPGGFVCEGADGITSNLEDPAVKAASVYHADTTKPFPYPGYGTSRGAPMYTRLPTAEEQRGLEGDPVKHAAEYAKFLDRFEPAKRPPAVSMPLGEVPEFLRNGGHVPNVLGLLYPKDAVSVGSSWPGMRLSFQGAFEHQGRSYYYTTEGWVVPTDDFRVARLAEFHGVELAREGEPGERLPFVWAHRKPARIFTIDEKSGKGIPLGDEIVLPQQGHLEILEKDALLRGLKFHEIKTLPESLAKLLANQPKGQRYFVRYDEVVRIDASKELPYKSATDEAWVEVNIAKQAMVYYRGLTPIFATLVSTGSDYLADPATSHATPRGMYRVHSKHVTVKMSADEKPPKEEGGKAERAYRVDDVPYVQYFSAGYAFHAAYWHDDFGQPRSHGCINLSPRDAMWLFHHTYPRVPSGWHGVYANRAGAADGTLIVIRSGLDPQPPK
jgi:hypothetical protein